MMPDMFLYLPCLELASCSCSCKQWLDILKHGFSWNEYCMGFRLPMPLCSYEALRRYAACLAIMGRCLLRYKVYVDRRRNVPWHRPLCDATGVCDLSGLGGPSCMSRNGFASPLREHLQTLFLFFGALPCDYVAALHTVWRPGKDFALGDVLLIQNGVPLIGSMCKDPVTNRCAVSIGCICPNGFGGHVVDYDFDVYELIMSYHVNSHGQAIDVCYNGVCHDQIGVEMVGPFGSANAAAAVAALRPHLYDLALSREFMGDVAVYTFNSFVDVVSVCIQSIERPGLGHRFFLPCFLYWKGLECVGDDGASTQVSGGVEASSPGSDDVCVDDEGSGESDGSATSLTSGSE